MLALLQYRFEYFLDILKSEKYQELPGMLYRM
jgi:hypothetical protein